MTTPAGMNHGFAVAWFALRCLAYELAHPNRIPEEKIR